MSKYAEYVTGSIKNRNKIYRVGDFKLNGIDTDCYRSIFLFDEGLKGYVDKTGSVSGYAGNHLADGLVFDFDGEPLDEVKNTVIDFVKYLEALHDVPVNYIRIAFSGNKGFHISIPFAAVCEHPKPTGNFYKSYKGMIHDITDGWGFLDTSIYEIRRVIRMTNTKHSGSGLYKIPLSFQELQSLGIDEIKELAKQPRKDFEQLPASEISEIPALRELYDKWSAAKFDNPKSGRVNGEAYSELFKPQPQGNRTKTAMQIIGHLIKHNTPEPLALEIIRSWNALQDTPLPDDKLDYTVRDAYQRYNKPIEGNLADYFYTPERAFNEKYKPYVQGSEKKQVRTGFLKVDKYLRGLRSGEVLAIVGKTGNAKSAFAQNVGHNYAKQSGEPVVFFSLEMPMVSVIERTFQIETGLCGYDIERETLRIINGEPSQLNMKANLVFSKLPNFYTIEKSGLTLEQIKQFTRYGEENIYHKTTGLIIIDYLSLLDGRGKDIFERTALLARELKELAKELDVPVVFLSQVTKNKSQYDELELDSGRDSGAIAEVGDFVVGLWKQDETDESIQFILAVLKNRRGKTGKIKISMNRRSLQFSEME
jgi:KaiC/GvpD/RAD55 family RecA-like ATPase